MSSVPLTIQHGLTTVVVMRRVMLKTNPSSPPADTVCVRGTNWGYLYYIYTASDTQTQAQSMFITVRLAPQNSAEPNFQIQAEKLI